jgi:hypothetical protein
VFLVSTYCLSISHFLGFLNDALLRDDIAENVETKQVLD